MIEAITIPDIGENVVSGKVVAVNVKVGDVLAVDDTVLELETDKAVVEIPSPFNGRVTEVLAREGQEMKVGEVIARVETDVQAGEAQVDDAAPASETPSSPKAVPAQEAESTQIDEPAKAEPQDAPSTKAATADQAPYPVSSPAGDDQATPVAASPSIRRMARELGVDLRALSGSGPGGRITQDDLKAHVRQARQAVTGPPAGAMVEPDLPDFTRWGKIETVALETVRHLTARSTTTSWRTIPHVTQFDEADVTHLDRFIQKNAASVKRAGGKLTLTAILTKVCADALKKYPRFNASIDLKAERLIFKKYVNICIAVDTPRGLLMPVIRNADQKGISTLAVEILDLAGRAREKKIRQDELEGGTFSISNQGGIGGVAFTPIVLWPQAAILGMSRSAVMPRFISGEFQPRNILPLSLSYDHRIIDGADAARFLRWVCDCLEQPMTLSL